MDENDAELVQLVHAASSVHFRGADITVTSEVLEVLQRYSRDISIRSTEQQLKYLA